MIAEITNAAGGGLDQLMNLVPTPGKLTILPVKEFGSVPVPVGPPFSAMFNPDHWEEQERYCYWDDVVPGVNGAVHQFKNVASKNLSFELLFDGTGASGEKREVTEELARLRLTLSFNGILHRPNLLIVIWGYFIFKGIIQSQETQYTLFRPNGTPLRAKVKLSFAADTNKTSRLLDMNLFSSDLTHRRLVHAGDRLDNLCNTIYDSPRHLLDVAKANGLTTFRRLPVGQELIFPPIEK